ncbi:MAG: S-adenosyl-methyltransferase [Flavobacteriales bacterium]|nr:S-adenosyl-methyltransferase [Flavobacteriales bacterium]
MTKPTNKTSSETAIAKQVLGILGGSFLTRDSVLNNIPFILFLFAIGILYIGNSHFAESSVITANRLNRELKELRSDFISTRSELMFVSKQSEVAKAVASMGIYESVVPPKKIIITQEENPEK